MGYNIKIGNAKIDTSNDDGWLEARWYVEYITHKGAPVFQNDTMTGNGNTRHPSYTTWSIFADEVGLKDLFYGPEGLLYNHPGCIVLTKEHHAQVASALEIWKKKSTKPPGFAGFSNFNSSTGEWCAPPDEGRYDHQLARLIWLEWWMRWALENCEIPAFENS